jgi:4-amino-4-deoxy-L-arabinose transferase-like glycosyltransferase
MPQITYIDTEAPQPREKARFWRAALRQLVRFRVPLLALMALYRFVGLSFGEMQQWDEAIYALRVQTVLQFGDVLDQSPNMLSGLYYAVHPPLYVWCSTALVMLLGDATWVYRLTSALAAAALVPLVYHIARSSGTAGRALAVAGLFAFAPLPTFFSRQGQLDMLLALGMLGALYFAWKSVRSGRAGDTFLAGMALGAALLTKFAFALSVPAAVLLSAVLAPPFRRRRILRVAFLMTLLSLPLWLPWFAVMTARHGGGDLLWLFSPSLPLGATFHGMEGSAKDTGMLFYFNQLVIHVSLLLPFAVVGAWEVLRPTQRPSLPHRGMLPLAAVFVLLHMAALLFMRSSFTVYLIPAVPLLFYLAAHGLALTRRAGRRPALAMTSAAMLCLAWSLFPAGRVAVKETLGALRRGTLPAEGGTALLALAGTAAAGLLIAWLLYRRGRLRPLLTQPLLYAAVAVLAVTTTLRIWTQHPRAYVDGAAEAVAALKALDADRVLLVGNGDNPQLTWYLRGADIGWVPGEERRYQRLEPHALGAEGIRDRAARIADTARVAMLIERDEITAGVYRAPRDVMPADFRVLHKTRRYVVVGEGDMRP